MSHKSKFNHLLAPGRIGSVKTRNRMVKTASGLAFGDPDRTGYVSRREIVFYEAIARGGVGMIIAGASGVDYPLGTTRPLNLHIEDDNYIPSYYELTQASHRHGCPAFLQLFHAGPGLASDLYGVQPVSSSSLTENEMRVLAPAQKRPLRELTVAGIEDIVGKFVSAAGRAQKAGFDGVEINASAGHLLNSFLSRAWNKRQDSYGCGDLNSRTRILVEIIRGIKNRLGQDFPVAVQINAAEYGHDLGTTLEEGQDIARILQQAGADAIQARPSGFGDYGFMVWPEWIFYPEPPKVLPGGPDWSHRGAGAEVPIAAAVKKVVSIPVITVGRLDPEMGEKILRDGQADFIGLVRRLIADPELPNKIASGRLDDIAPCTACHTCMTNAINEPSRCRINAAVSGEQEYIIRPADTRKKVVVIGGGPAGMEAARVAALRGHEVILYEKERKLGGLLPLASVIKGFEVEDMEAIIRYLKSQLIKLGVETRTGKEVNQSVIEEVRPDVVILATGGMPQVPEIKGIDRPIVVSSPALHRKLKTCLRLLGPGKLSRLTKLWMPIGKNVIVIGGGIHGCELAEFLVKRGRRVTIVETAQAPGEGLLPDVKVRLFGWLANRGVTVVTGARYEEVTGDGLAIITREGKRQTLKADTILTAMPLVPDSDLFKNLEGKVPEIYAIGDGSAPGLIVDAIASGYRVASRL